MLLYLSLFTILISIILILNNWKSNKNAFFLASLFFIMAIYALVHYAVVYSKSVFMTVVFYNNFMPLMFLLGPFLFFYIRGVLIQKKGFVKGDLFHFLPFLINFIAILPYYLTSYTYKVHLAQKIIANPNLVLIYNVNFLFSPVINLLMRPAFFIIYILFSLYFVCTHLKIKSKKKGIPFWILLKKHQWYFGLLLILLVLIGSFLIISYIFVRTFSYQYVLSFSWYYVLTGVLFSSISLSLLFFPKILYGVSMEVENPKNKTKIPSIKPLDSPILFLREEGFNFVIDTNDPFYDLANKIVDYYKSERPYLNPKYSISNLSIELNVPEKNILYCFNSLFNISFLKFSNHLRIQYAKELLGNNALENFTIDAIGENAGFSTRSNFYTTFKKIVGCSPTEYLKSIEIRN